jgi:L-alanine-DL-glutamate epimerase-like enolase superfamily enzyme
MMPNLRLTIELRELSMENVVIERVDAVTLEGKRPRAAGSNARLGHHGDVVRLPLVRLTTTDGVIGWGRTSVDPSVAASLAGQSLGNFINGSTVHPDWTAIELPLLDLASRIAGQPVHRFVSGSDPLPVRSYDTSLYFDDLHLDSDDEAAALIAAEARQGWDRGHRAFKIKVGRGAMHMPLKEGTARDIAIIHAVRDAIGPDATVMIDANNGWNLNLTKQVLTETADANLYWIEEVFHEDNVLYQHLKEWQAAEGLNVLIADGEGVPDPRVGDWAREGIIDVVQTNIYQRGFGNWHTLGEELDALGVQSSPHTYGSGIGNYITSQLAATLQGLNYVEWDEAHFDAIDASAFTITEGVVTIPEAPGFGLELDHDAFNAAVAASGVSFVHS